MNFSRTRLSLQEVFNKCLPVMSIQAISPPFPQIKALQRIDLYSHYIFQIQPNCQICIYIFTTFECLLIYQLLILHVRKIKTRDTINVLLLLCFHLEWRLKCFFIYFFIFYDFLFLRFVPLFPGNLNAHLLIFFV